MKHGIEISHLVQHEYQKTYDFHFELIRAMQQHLGSEQVKLYVKAAHNKRIHRSGFTTNGSKIASHWMGLSLSSVDVGHSLADTYLRAGKKQIGHVYLDESTATKEVNWPSWITKADELIFGSEATRQKAASKFSSELPGSKIIYWPPLSSRSQEKSGLQFEKPTFADLIFVKNKLKQIEIETFLTAVAQSAFKDSSILLAGALEDDSQAVDDTIGKLNMTAQVTIMENPLGNELQEYICQSKYLILHDSGDTAAATAIDAMRNATRLAITTPLCAAAEVSEGFAVSAAEQPWDVLLQELQAITDNTVRQAKHHAAQYSWEGVVKEVLVF